MWVFASHILITKSIFKLMYYDYTLVSPVVSLKYFFKTVLSKIMT